MPDLMTFDIQNYSLKKRWFGFKTEDGKLAESAVLVYYDADKTPITAHVYETGETFTGELYEVLTEIQSISRNVFEQITGKQAPNCIERGFMTQPWQGETRATACGKLFYVKPDND